MEMMEQDTDKMTPNDKAFNLPNLILNKKIFNSMVPVVSLKHKKHVECSSMGSRI